MAEKQNRNFKQTTLWLCLTAIFMAMNVALSSFGVPVPGGHLYLNDIVICTAAILLDPVAAFIVGGVGAFLGDFFFYPTPMFVSLVTHGLQAVVISLLAHHILKKRPVLASGIGVAVGAVIMVVGYSLGRAFIYSTPEYALMKLPYQILQAVVGAVVAMILVWKCGINKLFQKTVARAGRA
ncbi:MAG: ECF transporter S component [Oscillospiraceae bacterium]|nr:ECF transporter S component [Oscillospiraceae bacterium]MDD6145489.1 ECF transporter S component [Oscillospiraceae bacterium]